MGRDPHRRYSRRMRRALRGRHDAYPMLILSPPEPYVRLALAEATRWAYHNRTAFAPFLIAAGSAAAAAYLHNGETYWWIPVLTATVIVTTLMGVPHSLLRKKVPAGNALARGLSRLWESCGIDRAIERTYSAVVIGVTGGWLAAAIAASPAAWLLPQIAGAASVVLGIPWWFHRRRRAKARVERIIAGWPNVAENVGLPGAEIVSAVVDAWGWTARVIMKKGNITQQAITRIPAIESGLKLRPGSVRITGDQGRADRFTMRVVENDPHAQPVPWHGASITSITQPVTIGISEDGRPVRILILRRNLLAGGMTGAGKSGILNVLLAYLAACHDVVLWGVDLKGGMELQPWAGCFERLAVTPEQASELFRDAVTWLNQRAARMAAQGKRVWEPTPENPALIIIVDEYAELPSEAHVCADSIARRGRAVAVNLFAATQRPTQAAMGNTAVRSQMDIRICLRVKEPRDVDLIMGAGSLKSGWQAHTLTQPGVFLLADPEHTQPDRHRAYLISDEQIARQAARCAPWRPTLGAELPQAPQMAPGSAQSPEPGDLPVPDHEAPETILWAALRDAGPHGISAAALVKVTGKGRTWVYERLRQLAINGRAVQTIRGRWRAADATGSPGADTAQ